MRELPVRLSVCQHVAGLHIPLVTGLMLAMHYSLLDTNDRVSCLVVCQHVVGLHISVVTGLLLGMQHSHP